jgi:hypothetical protein
MSKFLIAVMGALILVLPAAAHAQSGGAENVRAARTYLVGTSPPDAGVQAGDGLSLWSVVAFYARPDTRTTRPSVPFPKFWIARRTVGNGVGATDVYWTDQDRCPQLIGLVLWLDRLDVPAMQMPGAGLVPPEGVQGAPVPRPIEPDGQGRTTYEIWGPARDSDGVLLSVSMAGNGDSIADFGDAVQERLSNCWTPE